MSEVLKGQLPDLEEQEQQLSDRFVMVVANWALKPLIGGLRTVLFADDPEVEFRVSLEEALEVVESDNKAFDGFEFRHGSRTINIRGSYVASAVRITDVEVDSEPQMCTLVLGLKRVSKE